MSFRILLRYFRTNNLRRVVRCGSGSSRVASVAVVGGNVSSVSSPGACWDVAWLIGLIGLIANQRWYF